MKIYDNLVQTVRYANNYLGSSWRHRLVQVMGLGLCASLLYYLAPRIRNLFAKKDAPPANPNLPPLPQPKINLLEVWREAEKPKTPHPAENLPHPEIPLDSAFPDEILLAIFIRTHSLPAWYALSMTCRKFQKVTQERTAFLEDVIKSIIKEKINPLIENRSTDASNAENLRLNGAALHIISYFPPAVLCPEPNGSCISIIQNVIGKLSTTNLISNPKIGMVNHNLLHFRIKKFCPSGIDICKTVVTRDKKFLYNFPDVNLSFWTRGEIEELSRRYDLKQLSKAWEKKLSLDEQDATYASDKDIIEFHAPRILTWSSGPFLKYLLEIWAKSVVWENWISHLHLLKKPQHFREKLCLLGEHYKYHHHKWSYDKPESDDLALLLFPTMKALGWENGTITQNPLPIGMDTILLWLPENALDDINGFATAIQKLPQIPEQSLYGYSYNDLFSFMQYLASHRPKLRGLPSEYSIQLLQETLEIGGVAMDFSEGLWETDLMRASWQDAYVRLFIWGDYYKLHYHCWSPKKKTSTLEMLLFPAMKILHREGAKEKKWPIKSKKEDPLPEDTQLSFKSAVFSWIPQEYYIKENFLADSGRKERTLQASDDPYTYEDLFAFIEALRKEFESQL